MLADCLKIMFVQSKVAKELAERLGFKHMPEFKMEDILIDRYGNDLRKFYHLVSQFAASFSINYSLFSFRNACECLTSICFTPIHLTSIRPECSIECMNVVGNSTLMQLHTFSIQAIFIYVKGVYFVLFSRRGSCFGAFASYRFCLY